MQAFLLIKIHKILLQIQKQCNNKKVSIRKIIEQFRILPLKKGGLGYIYQIEPSNRYAHELVRLEFKSSKSLVMKKIPKKVSLNTPENQESYNIGFTLFLQNKCPFLIKGLHHTEDDEHYFQVMQKIEGGDLTTFRESISGKGYAFKGLGEQGIRMVVCGVLQGLSFIHNHNIILCDLKLQNVVIGVDGYPLLIDFDFVKLGPTFESAVYRGTPAYIAPEIFTDHQVGKAIDLWALGIFIYTLVYEQVPYDASDVVSQDFLEKCVCKQNKYGLKRKKISKSLKDLINSLLKFDPSQRLRYKDTEQISQHSFFQDFNWQAYRSKKMHNPIKNIVKKYCKKMDKQVLFPLNLGQMMNQMNDVFSHNEVLSPTGQISPNKFV